MGLEDEWDRVDMTLRKGGFPVPKGQARFEWLKVFGGRFKRRKKKGETFTQFMQRIGVWKKG